MILEPVQFWQRYAMWWACPSDSAWVMWRMGEGLEEFSAILGRRFLPAMKRTTAALRDFGAAYRTMQADAGRWPL